MADHIGKPIDPQELNRVLSRYRHSADAERTPRVPSDDEQQHANESGRRYPEPSAGFDSKRQGLDIEGGLQRAGGSAPFYARLILDFVRQFQDFESEVRACLSAGRAHEAVRLAHSLKGVSATLGATGLAQCAGELEECLARGKGAEDALAAAVRGVDAAGTALNAWVEANGVHPLAPTIAAEAGTFAPGAWPDWVPELRALLEDGDVRAHQLWIERGGELMSSLPVNVYGQVRRSIENFEFEAALNMLPAAPVVPKSAPGE
jgi:HPt (histidine-containing phosphotransfer) domain-containing protein